ncbi:hypothetical protein NNC19_13080 [Clostridium sp. SHJSY1]|uniref:hypothetical protein n=1 Tax=Clostridium sp. SHJSY1 TaxID=2942483 RepID=UPI002874D888|nr:hypothetical protein [Clostridium sp. SHJSY1]MDS0526618.1 hypothetical protein [Clostridium sp. SHJSY1]
MYRACVIVISDKGYTGEEEDIKGKSIVEYLGKNKFDISSYTIVPEVKDIFKRILSKCCDEYRVELVVVVDSNNLTKEVYGEIDQGISNLRAELNLKDYTNLDLKVKGETLILNLESIEDIPIDIVEKLIGQTVI